MHHANRGRDGVHCLPSGRLRNGDSPPTLVDNRSGNTVVAQIFAARSALCPQWMTMIEHHASLLTMFMHTDRVQQGSSGSREDLCTEYSKTGDRGLLSTATLRTYSVLRILTTSAASADGLHYGDLTATSHAAPASSPFSFSLIGSRTGSRTGSTVAASALLHGRNPRSTREQNLIGFGTYRLKHYYRFDRPIYMYADPQRLPHELCRMKASDGFVSSARCAARSAERR